MKLSVPDEPEPDQDDASTSNAPLTEAEVRAELERILASHTFATQDRLRKFLSYVVDRTLAGHGAELKETAIGGPEELVTPDLPGRMWGTWRLAKKGVYFLTLESEKPYSGKLWLYDFASRTVISIPESRYRPTRAPSITSRSTTLARASTWPKGSPGK